MAEHVAYDTDKRIIYVTTAPVDGVVDISIKEHLYSDMKVDWQANATLGKFKLPLRSVGGDALPGSKSLGATFFLDSDWKIRPYEADHIFRMEGNLFSEDGRSVMIPTTGGYQVLAEMFVSNLTDSTIQQLEAVDLLTYSGKLYYDENSSNTGQLHPIGTAEFPVNNITDGFAIAQLYSLGEMHILSDVQIDRDLESFVVVSAKPNVTVFANGFKANNFRFDKVNLSGDFNGSYVEMYQGNLLDSYNIHGKMKDVVRLGTVKITGGQSLVMSDCESGIPGLDSPVTDMNAGFTTYYSNRNYSGGETIINCDTVDDIATLSYPDGGKPHLEPSCTAGLLSVRGTGALDDRSNGTTVELSAWTEADDLKKITALIEADEEKNVQTNKYYKRHKDTKEILVEKDYNKDGSNNETLIEP